MEPAAPETRLSVANVPSACQMLELAAMTLPTTSSTSFNRIGEVFANECKVPEADRIQWADRRFRRELADWLHPDRAGSRDGIPGYALGTNRLPAYVGPLVIRTFDLGEGRGAKDREIALDSPVLAVLGTDSDTAADWMKAGQALANVLLRARVEDLWASFLNQPNKSFP